MDGNDGAGRLENSGAIKKCPYCNSFVRGDAVRCDVCRRRIGAADGNGLAKKPMDIAAYLTAAGALAALAAYLRWAFGG
jgi:hypothetical protein